MGLRLSVRSEWKDDEAYSLEFDQDRIVIGRRSGCDVQLPHAAVSGHHATIRVNGSMCAIVDSSSTNGVRVNAQRLTAGRAKQLADGDEIRIGGFILSVSICAVASSATAEGTRSVARRLLHSFDDEEVEHPSLFFLNGDRAGEQVILPSPPSSLIAGRGAALHLPDGDASREHAEFVHALMGVDVRDLGSKNGIEVGGVRVSSRRLRHGDELRIGATLVRFNDPADEALRAIVELEDEVLVPEDELSVDVEEPDPESPADASNEVRHELEETAAGLELPPAPTAPRADVAIYALAGAMLALSLAGLVWLASN